MCHCTHSLKPAAVAAAVASAVCTGCCDRYVLSMRLKEPEVQGDRDLTWQGREKKKKDLNQKNGSEGVTAQMQSGLEIWPLVSWLSRHWEDIKWEVCARVCVCACACACWVLATAVETCFPLPEYVRAGAFRAEDGCRGNASQWRHVYK